MTRTALAVLLLAFTSMLSSPASFGQEPVAFTRAPTAVRRGGEVRIEFAVNRATDVAVSVVDAKGKVIRHLVAGVLGKNPPPPLRPDSLDQSITWDGKDDFGKPAGGGPFRVRVSLGLTPTFEKLIGNNPADVGSIRGMAVGPDGKLYVIHCYGGHHPLDGTGVIAVFSRAGKYLKTIAPFPAGLADEKLGGIRTVRLANGGRVPFVYQFETRSCLPGLGDLPKQRAVVTRDGRLVFVGIQEGPKCFAQPGEARLTVIHTDGGVPKDGVLKALVHPLTDSGASLALSPDEKTIYATGVRAGMHPCGPTGAFTCQNCDHRGATWRHTVPVPFVFACGWDADQVTVFLGRGARGQRGKHEFKEPVSVATDGDGNLYVADLADDKVRVFDTEGAELGRIKVTSPIRVEVHKKTGAIYVLTGDKKIELLKFDGYKTGREVARIHVKTYRWMWPLHRPLMALDDTADPPVIWCSSNFYRIEDRGTRFTEPVSMVAPERIGPSAMASVMEMSVDRVHHILYVNNRRRCNLLTGEWSSFKTPGGRMWPTSNPGSASGAAGRDGCYYVNLGAKRGRLLRYGPDLKLRKFPVTEDEEGRLCGYARNRGRGQTADYRGNVYVLWKKCGGVSDEGDFHRAHVLSKFAPDGTPVDKKLVNCQIPSISSPRVDRQGNIYVAVGLRPGKHTVPAELRGQVREGAKDPDCVNGVNSYPMIYGSIVKFGPAGGTIFQDAGGVRCNFAYGRPIDVKGAKWIVPGISVASSWATPKGTEGTTIVCLCENPSIDVDEFGRTFYPDAGRARVGVLDTAGNEVCTFGKYGNPDSTGLSFWWPQAVAVDGGHAYVGDRLNRRIVAAKLAYQAEATFEVK